MKITINSKNLLKAVQKVGGCIRSKNVVPILDSLLISSEGQNLYITASNMEITATTKIPASITGEINTCIPYITLSGILKNFPSGPVDITLTNKLAKLVCGASEYEIPLYDPKAFPKDMDNQWSNSFVINTTKFCEALKKSIPFTDPSDDLSGFNSVVFYSKGTHSKVGGVTPHKILESTIGECKEVFKLAMHSNAANFVANNPFEDEEIRVSYSDNMIQLEGGLTTIKITQSTKFPPEHEGIFDAHKAKEKISIDKAEFLVNINKLYNIAGHQPIKFDIDDGKITATAHNSFTEAKGREIFDCELDGEPLTVGFSANILKAMLGVIEDEILTLEISQPTRPCVVQTADSRMVVMPHSI